MLTFCNTCFQQFIKFVFTIVFYVANTICLIRIHIHQLLLFVFQLVFNVFLKVLTCSHILLFCIKASQQVWHFMIHSHLFKSNCMQLYQRSVLFGYNTTQILLKCIRLRLQFVLFVIMFYYSINTNPGADPAPNDSPKPPRDVFLCILDQFWIDLGWFRKDFGAFSTILRLKTPRSISPKPWSSGMRVSD